MSQRVDESFWHALCYPSRQHRASGDGRGLERTPSGIDPDVMLIRAKNMLAQERPWTNPFGEGKAKIAY